MRATIMGEIGRVESELAGLTTNRAKALLPRDQPLRTAWQEATVDWKRDVIQLIVDKVIVHPGHPGSRLWNGHRFDPDLIEIRWKA
jgi:site-specific DNA recombinase